LNEIKDKVSSSETVVGIVLRPLCMVERRFHRHFKSSWQLADLGAVPQFLFAKYDQNDLSRNWSNFIASFKLVTKAGYQSD